jgi:hypothetical protein
MNLDEFVDQLFAAGSPDKSLGLSGEEADSADQGDIDPANLQAFVDRLLLRLFDTVSLMQYLKQVSVLKKNGVPVVQLVFAQIPDDVIGDTQRIISTPSQAYKFKQDATPYVGFEVPLKAEMFPATT